MTQQQMFEEYTSLRTEYFAAKERAKQTREELQAELDGGCLARWKQMYPKKRKNPGRVIVTREIGEAFDEIMRPLRERADRAYAECSSKTKELCQKLQGLAVSIEPKTLPRIEDENQWACHYDHNTLDYYTSGTEAGIRLREGSAHTLETIQRYGFKARIQEESYDNPNKLERYFTVVRRKRVFGNCSEAVFSVLSLKQIIELGLADIIQGVY